MGKIINLLASDFNTMEIRLMFVFMMVAFPFILIGASVVLVFRLGWVGLICIAFPILMMPVQGLIGKRNGQILVSLNVEKDVRVKTTGEVIEGIRFIKLYAWEIAFNKIIGKLRSIEIAKYMKIYLGQSFDRALSNSTIYWGMIICFVLMHFTGVGLDSSKIFSTVELMTFIKVNLFLAAMGISYIYELKVLFKRFADIYTVENVVMKKIDETTKKPVPEENEKPKNQNMSESMHTLVVPNQI
jgi:ATP-binding cassette subfamily C (CFTR/MRP) protein 4